MLNQREAVNKVKQIVSGLGAIPARDALEVLQLAIAEVLRQSESTNQLDEALDCRVALRNVRGRLSMIVLDEELRAYIHSFTARDTVKQIAKACASKFGENRAPSTSSIHRYLQTLKYRGRARQ